MHRVLVPSAAVRRAAAVMLLAAVFLLLLSSTAFASLPPDWRSAADPPDSPRNVRSEQGLSAIAREHGVYLCPEGVLGGQEAAGASSQMRAGSASPSLARMARCEVVVSVR